MAKYSRFDPRNKKSGRKKKGEYEKKIRHADNGKRKGKVNVKNVDLYSESQED